MSTLAGRVTKLLPLLLPLPLPLLAALLASAVLGAQDPKPVPDAEDPAIAAQIDQLDDAFKDRKMSRDGEAIGFIRELGTAADSGLHPKDNVRVLRAMRDVLNKGRLREADQRGVYEAAAVVLQKLGPDGAKMLSVTYDRKRFPTKPEWAPMRAALVDAIGETRDPKMIDFLCSCARGAPEDAVLAAAGRALGRFVEAEQKDRKDMVKILATKLSSLEAEATRQVSNRPGDQQDFGPQNAKRMLDAITVDWKASLVKLSGESFATGGEWLQWFNKNKGKDWDEARRAGAPDR